MKIISVIFTALLLIPVVVWSIPVFQFYFPANHNVIRKDAFFSIAEPAISYAFFYLVFFILSVLLNVKRKFTINVILSGTLVLIFLVTINLISKTWLK